MEVLDYLQITSGSPNVPSVIVENCAEFSQELQGFVIFFEESEKEEIKDSIAASGTINAIHCSQLFKQNPKEALKILLKHDGWNSFTEYFIHKAGGFDALFEKLNKNSADQFINYQQNFFGDGVLPEDEEVPLAQEDSPAEEGDSAEENDAVDVNKQNELTTECTSESKEPLAQKKSEDAVKEIQEMVDSLIFQKEQENIEKLEKQVLEKKEHTKSKIKGELMDLIKTSNPHGSPFNISINAKDFAKWKNNKEKSIEEEESEDEPSQLLKPSNGPPDENKNEIESIQQKKDNSRESQSEEINVSEKVDVSKEENNSGEDFSFLIGNLTELVANVKENVAEIKNDLITEKENEDAVAEEKFKQSLETFENYNEQRFNSVDNTLANLGNTLIKNQECLQVLIDRNEQEALAQDISQVKSNLETSLEENRDNSVEIRKALAKLDSTLSSINEKIENDTEQTLTNQEQLNVLANKLETVINAINELSDKFSEAFVDDDDDF